MDRTTTIGEWYGIPFATMPPSLRQSLAVRALNPKLTRPPCPFKPGGQPCTKAGGMCSMQDYETIDGRIGAPVGSPVIVCPTRFDQNEVVPRWLAKIAGFSDVHVAREVPFMRDPNTGREAGRIDMVVASNERATDWYGLEVQSVYFSGALMAPEFELLKTDAGARPPASIGKRRADWRSSSAKRLMPQLQVKTPTLRTWGKKVAVAVDRPFFDALGGPSANPSKDTNEGDIIWLVPRLDEGLRLVPDHWEVLSLEASSKKLIAADPVKRDEFETSLRGKLTRL